jgi:acid phosphatase
VAACISLLFAGMPGLACPCNEIPKPDPQKKSGPVTPESIAFTRSADYRKEFAAAIAGAKQAVLQHLNEAKPAVVADIDETILDNREEFQSHPDFKWSEFDQWVQQANAPTLKPTADFLACARKQGCAVFLITGRPESERAATIQNLVRRGVAYDGLYMRPGGDIKGLAEDIKSNWRKQIENMGFHIVTNIGDQNSDLYGGFSIDCEKLPNKMYYIP